MHIEQQNITKPHNTMYRYTNIGNIPYRPCPRVAFFEFETGLHPVRGTDRSRNPGGSQPRPWESDSDLNELVTWMWEKINTNKTAIVHVLLFPNWSDARNQGVILMLLGLCMFFDWHSDPCQAFGSCGGNPPQPPATASRHHRMSCTEVNAQATKRNET